MINKTVVKNFVDNNPELVHIKRPDQDLTILKYKNKVFFKDLWTPELCEMRGTIIDDNYEIVQRPFTKIFNYTEKKAPRFNDNDEVICVTKINGFMAAATWHNNKVLVSTTGTIDSEYAELARSYLEQYAMMFERYDAHTFIFEIVDPNDPHVVKEKPGAYLLGARIKCWNALNHCIAEEDLDQIANQYKIFRPAWKVTTFDKVLAEVKTVTHEGFVVYQNIGTKEIKIKSPFYLATKFFGRKTEKRLNEILDDPREAKKIVDEEYYVAIDYLAAHKEEFIAMNEQERFEYLRNYFEKEVL